MSLSSSTAECPFELLELPDGRWCVAKLTASAPDTTNLETTEPAGHNPVGFYDSQDEAELAILRSSPSPSAPLSMFAGWLQQR